MDECVDDILLIVWYNISSYDANLGQFRSWLLSVAKFKAIDYKRKSNKAYQLQEFQRHLYEEVKDVNQSKGALNDNIYVLIKELNDEDMEIFIKRYITEYSVKEIVSNLGMTSNTVYSRLLRGRKKLKKILGGKWNK